MAILATVAGRRAAGLAIVAAAIMTAGIWRVAIAASPDRATAHPGWHVSTIFGPGVVESITGVGRHDAWLAGVRSSSGNSIFVQHWNGGTWQPVPTPAAMQTEQGVVIAASSPSDTWVFSYTRPAITPGYSLGWHWNGRQWRDSKFGNGVSIAAASVLSTTDAWAFGESQLPSRQVPYAARYDGRGWRRVKVPLLVTAASAMSPDEIWIAGYVPGKSGSPVAVAKWTGRSWHVLTLPRLPVPKGGSYGWPSVLALTPTDIWTDFELRNSSQVTGVVLLHYGGSGWERVPVPYRSTGLGAMSADGHGGIWITAVISGLPGSAIYDYRAGRWSRQATPVRRGVFAGLDSIASAPGSASAWAGGYAIDTSGADQHGLLFAHQG